MSALPARDHIYRTAPLRHDQGIPIFSEADAYNANYEKIAADHLAAQEPGKDNPFIENDLWEEMEQSTRNLVQKHVPAGARVLDVGVGLGRVMGPLTQYDRYGIDISLDYLRKAQAQGIEVAYARIEDMPYEDASFDAVVTCDVLEHVFDLYGCTKEILRVLKPGGTLIVRVPNKEDLDVYLRDDLGYEFIHLRSFDHASLRLHFSKIFGCIYIEHETVTPYLQGAPRFKIRLMSTTNTLRHSLKKISWLDIRNQLYLLKWATLVSEEYFVNWTYKLRDKEPDLFAKIANDLIHGIEINAVFQKP